MHGSKVDERDRAIGARLREFRNQIRWGQPEFGRAVGLTRDQLASIERGRTPLRYETAWRIRITFNLNLEWLSGDGGIVDEPSDDGFPTPESLELGPRCVFDEVAKLVFERKRVQGSPGPRTEGDIARREAARLVIDGYLHDWLARVPSDYVMTLVEAVIAAAVKFLKECPADSHEAVRARAAALQWERVRQTTAKRFIVVGDQSGLTSLTPKRNPSSVTENIPTWEEVIERAKAVTTEPGSKGKLAKALGVKPPRLSEWLAGGIVPGAAVAFRLLEKVVGLEKAKTKSASGATNSAGAKATQQDNRRSTDESKSHKSGQRKGSPNRPKNTSS